MAYIINLTNGTQLASVEDGTIDQSTTLKLVGKNYAGYGEIQNENFLHMLENFAGGTAPSRPIAGQMWYDSATAKLKFYDGSKFRTTGGAEISATAPTGLTTGDFWWDTANSQLYAWDGSSFILVGPQGVGSTVTQFTSRQIQDTLGAQQLIIEGKVNNTTVVLFSSTEFTIDSTQSSNTITGFDVVKKGITLVNTQAATNGVTSTDHRFFGTASNSDRLGGKLASDYLQASSTNFTSVARFADAGLTVGDSNDLKISIANGNEGVIANEVGTKIDLKVNVNNVITSIAEVVTTGINPGTGNRTLGTVTDKWYEVHATSFKGNSDTATAILQGGTSYPGSTTAQANTVALRDATNTIAATTFSGRATQANYADLAEIYKTDKEYPVGTVVSIGGDAEARAVETGEPILGVISENPGFLMNKDAEGQAVAFVGRVPVLVKGAINKGERVYANGGGFGTTDANGEQIGFALESNSDESTKLVEVVLRLVNN